MFADALMKMTLTNKLIRETQVQCDGLRYHVMCEMTKEILRIKRLRPEFRLEACVSHTKEDRHYIYDQLGHLIGRHPITRWKGSELEKDAAARTNAAFMLTKCAQAALWVYENEGKDVFEWKDGKLTVAREFLNNMKQRRNAS